MAASVSADSTASVTASATSRAEIIDDSVVVSSSGS